MAELPTVMTAAGQQPIAPADMRQILVDQVAATNPDYTANLPGTLIEDIASTDTAALLQSDQFRIDLINSLTPHGANQFLLLQLGEMIGVPYGTETHTSVGLIFTGSLGFPVPKGFTVSDGNYQYIVQNGGVVGVNGTGLLTAFAAEPGSWSVPANTVVNLVTSLPSGVTLAVTNPADGVPGGPPPSISEYRTQVLRAELAASQGMARYLKTLLRNVPGVQERLISVRQRVPAVGACGAWEILVGGNGDAYQIATAIFNSVFDISSLLPSAINVTGITRANPGVVTTDINHLLVTGQTIQMNGIVGMPGLNAVNLTATVISPHSFSVGVDTTGMGTWTSGGIVTPNARNVSVTVNDYPDTYRIPFVVPAAQNVFISATWNTTAVNFIGAANVVALAVPALIDYVNSIPAGQPIILFELENTFRNAVAPVLPPSLLTRMVFSVSIDGIPVLPSAGTGIIAGDPESYLTINDASIQILQG